MAELVTIARPYARALFKEACDSKTFNDWQQALAGLSMIVDALKAAHVIGNPNISDNQLLSLCCDTLADIITISNDFEKGLQRFIALVIDEKRLTVMRYISDLFHQLMTEYNNTVEVDVISASPLTDEQKQKLLQSLEQRFSSQVTIEYHDDPSLIGGLMIKSDNWVFDGSIRSKLTRLAERII